MNDCMNAGLRDALPDLLHGRLSALDTATLSAHVEGCAECKAELDVMRQVRASTMIVPKIDSSRIASMIAPYSGSSIRIDQIPARRQRSSGLVWKLATAALVVVAGVWGVNQSRVTPKRQVASAPAAVMAGPAVIPSAPEPAKASANESATAPVETQVASLSLVGNTQDLSDADLEQLLADLEGIETLPAAEPQSITPVLDESALDESGLDQ